MTTSMKVRTRFSPSPTGMLHIGNARAALFGALFAKKHHGSFILRIEDTDTARSEDQYIDALQEDLRWLGIDWDEGPGVHGHYGPYWQSQRQAIYATYYAKLEEQKRVYPCFCTDQELALARKLQLSRGLPPRYSGTCLKLSPEEVTARLEAGKQPAWRFHVPNGEKIEFVDIVKGEQSFSTDDIGDFIVRRADGTAPFLFCNAIDDAMMEITHVLRGEDHLTNTPRQLLILKALGLHIPKYGHLSLIVGDDGAPLSKRHGSFSVREMKKQGYLPIALINYLARLGHVCDSQELLNFHDLAPFFYLEKLSRSPARFDQVQLKYWQKMSVQTLDNKEIWRWLGESLEDSVPETKRNAFAQTIKSNIEFPEEAALWVQVFFQEEFPMPEESLTLLREAGASFFATAQQAVIKHGTQFQAVLADIKQTTGCQGKKLFMPIRAALTGQVHGPELAQIAELLGSDKLKQRLHRAETLAAI